MEGKGMGSRGGKEDLAVGTAPPCSGPQAALSDDIRPWEESQGSWPPGVTCRPGWTGHADSKYQGHGQPCSRRCEGVWGIRGVWGQEQLGASIQGPRTPATSRVPRSRSPRPQPPPWLSTLL